MLLNLSNHPSTKWLPQQITAAKVEFVSIEDLAFPNVPPAATEMELDSLVDKYVEIILVKKPTAVHLMGEMTFTFRLVTHLKAAGIHCIASTTNRTVEERDGKKIVQFEFVQFRAYYALLK